MTLSRIMLSAALLLVAACQQETVRPRQDAAAEIEAWTNNVQGPVPAAKPKNKGPVIRAREDGPAWDWDDPCVNNLQELSGLLLAWYQDHHTLPSKLDDLPGKSLGGEVVSLKCPADGKPYIYNRDGLIPPPDIVPEPQRARGGDRLIVYDADPAHEITQHLTDGTKDWDEKKMVRYGIVMKPPNADGSLALQVVPVEQALLDAYLRETEAEAKQPKVAPVTPRPANAGGIW